MSEPAFSISRTAFLSAVKSAQGVASKDAGNILSNLVVSTQGDGVRVLGTDYDATIQIDLPASVSKPGVLALAAKSVADIVKGLDSSHVDVLGLPNGWAQISAGRSTFKVAGINPADFPEVSIPAPAVWYGMPKATFRGILDKTSFCMSTDETRMALNGISLKIRPAPGGRAVVTVASTDGHRLSRVVADVEIANYDGVEIDAIAHRRGALEVRRLLDAGETLEIGFARGLVIFRTGGVTFSTRSVDETYPDIDRVIPRTSAMSVKVNREDLARAIRRVSCVSDPKTRLVKFGFRGGKVVLSLETETGTARDEVDAQIDGVGLDIGSNYTYIGEVLAAVVGETINIGLGSETEPMVLTAPAEPGAVFVVMPMRV